VSQQDNSKSYRRIFLKFWGYVGHGINYQWFNFGRDPTGILDSGLLWNFRYHWVKGGIREPLAKRRWWCHLVNSFALAEVPAGYDCFLVFYESSHIWRYTAIFFCESEAESFHDLVSKQPTLLRLLPSIGFDVQTGMDFLCLGGALLSFVAMVSRDQRNCVVFAVLWMFYLSLFQVIRPRSNNCR